MRGARIDGVTGIIGVWLIGFVGPLLVAVVASAWAASVLGEVESGKPLEAGVIQSCLTIVVCIGLLLARGVGGSLSDYDWAWRFSSEPRTRAEHDWFIVGAWFPPKGDTAA